MSRRPRDRYRSFGDLASVELEGYDFRREMCTRPSTIAVVAIHGGGIEPGASEVARAVAGEDMAWYCFEGIKPRANGTLHVASTRFDDPQCVTLAARSDLVFSVHGSEGDDPHVLVSGLAEDLVLQLIDALVVQGFCAARDCGACAGTDPRNICNRGRLGKGLQIEMSRGLRLTLFRGLSRRDRRVILPSFHHFAETIRSVLMPCAGGLTIA